MGGSPGRSTMSCGIPVTVTVRDVFNEFSDKVTFGTSVTFTDADGDFVRFHTAGQVTFSKVTNPDGTVTFMQNNIGLPEKLSAKGQGTLTRDAGRISFIETVDFSTDPPPLVSFEVVQSGPHPDADSDFALFCDVISEVLA